MTEENRTYITHLKVTDVPWHRLTTAYGRGTEFPAHLTVLEQMRDLASVKESLYELTTNMEHQSTLWHATPFGMVFLNRILEKALAESGQNPAAHFLAEELLKKNPLDRQGRILRMVYINQDLTNTGKYLFPELLDKFLAFFDRKGKTSLETMLNRWYTTLEKEYRSQTAE